MVHIVCLLADRAPCLWALLNFRNVYSADCKRGYVESEAIQQILGPYFQCDYESPKFLTQSWETKSCNISLKFWEVNVAVPNTSGQIVVNFCWEMKLSLRSNPRVNELKVCQQLLRCLKMKASKKSSKNCHLASATVFNERRQTALHQAQTSSSVFPVNELYNNLFTVVF